MVYQASMGHVRSVSYILMKKRSNNRRRYAHQGRMLRRYTNVPRRSRRGLTQTCAVLYRRRRKSAHFEVIEMMVDRRDAEASHRSNEKRAMEGADSCKETGKKTKIIEELEKTNRKSFQKTGNVIDNLCSSIETAVFNLPVPFDNACKLVIYIDWYCIGAESGFNNRIRGIENHFF